MINPDYDCGLIPTMRSFRKWCLLVFSETGVFVNEISEEYPMTIC